MRIYKPADPKLPRIKANSYLITQEGLQSAEPIQALENLVNANLLTAEDVDVEALKAQADKEKQEAIEAKQKAEELAKAAEEAKLAAEKEEAEAKEAAQKVEEAEKTSEESAPKPKRRKRAPRKPAQ